MNLRPPDLLSHEPIFWFRLWFINRSIFLGHKVCRPQTFYRFDVEFFKKFRSNNLVPTALFNELVSHFVSSSVQFLIHALLISLHLSLLMLLRDARAFLCACRLLRTRSICFTRPKEFMTPGRVIR